MAKKTIVLTGKPDLWNRAAHSAQGRYRFLTPFKELARYVPNLEFREDTTGAVPVMDGVDILLLHTPTAIESRDALRNAHLSGRKIWVDLDDYVFGGKGISDANIAWNYFSVKENKESLDIAMTFADVITCSTDHLRDLVIKYFPQAPKIKDKVVTIPNTIPDFLWARRRPFMEDQTDMVRILWRGSVTHEGDLLLFNDAFKPIKGVGYHFFGHYPWFFGKQYIGHLNMDREKHYTHWDRHGFYSYIETLKEMEAHWFVFPLENNDFNKAKSNICWLECTMAGMTGIVPKYMPEFEKIPAIKFTDSPESLYSLFNRAAKREFPRKEIYEKSCALIEEKYLLSHANQLRLEIINSL